MLDESQFGAIRGSLTIRALVVHDWPVVTNSKDTMVRALLLDYRKAFDLIDHRILMSKLRHLGLHVLWCLGWLLSCKNGGRVYKLGNI